MIRKNDFYNGNPKIKKAGVKQEYTPEQLEEYIRCKEDPFYFIKKYVKIVSLDEGTVNFNMRDYQRNMIENFLENRFSICLTPRQMGKDLDVNTPIPTPTGWTTVGDVEIGQDILARDGSITKITEKSEVYQNRRALKFIFDTGEEIIGSDTHLWNVCHNDWNGDEKTLEAKDVELKFLQSSTRPYIKINEPIDLPEKNLPIDPYVLGVWLGDGSSYHGQIYGTYDDLTEITNHIDYGLVSMIEQKSSWCARIDGLHKRLRENNLFENKHIPVEYLRASIQQRLELLRGLMDTDGSVEKSGRCEFYQKNGVLVEQVQELLSSLGIKHKIRWKEFDGSKYYATISFCTSRFEVFKLSRKVKRQRNLKDHPKNYRLYIKDIIEVESRPTQCIGVDNHEHLFLCGKTMVPTHNTITVAAFLLHYAFFHSDKSIAILANRGETAREILSRVKRMLEHIPFFLQPGVVEYNKGSVELGNGSTIMASSTSNNAIRGFTFNVIYLDEFAFVEKDVEFYTSTYPVITSGKKSKVIVTSTPNGMNLFYKLWSEAKTGRNSFKPIRVFWKDNPNYDEEFKKETIKNTSEKQWKQEYECTFFGSSGTLIDGEVLERLTWEEPLKETDVMKVWEEPKEDHVYLVTIDVGEGVGSDYSVIHIADITEMPYRQVCMYRDNRTSPTYLTEMAERLATRYNEAYILVETNAVGSQVGTYLFQEYEYENIILTVVKGQENVISGGFSGSTIIDYGLRTTKKSKRIGCSNLKTLIEENILLIRDFDTISELQTFTQKGQSYEAEDGKHDDIVMTLVILGWLSTQDYFKDLVNQDTRVRALANRLSQVEEELTPFGFVQDGGVDELNSDDDTGYVGSVW